MGSIARFWLACAVDNYLRVCNDLPSSSVSSVAIFIIRIIRAVRIVCIQLWTSLPATFTYLFGYKMVHTDGAI